MALLENFNFILGKLFKLIIYFNRNNFAILIVNAGEMQFLCLPKEKKRCFSPGEGTR